MGKDHKALVMTAATTSAFAATTSALAAATSAYEFSELTWLFRVFNGIDTFLHGRDAFVFVKLISRHAVETDGQTDVVRIYRRQRPAGSLGSFLGNLQQFASLMKLGFYALLIRLVGFSFCRDNLIEMVITSKDGAYRVKARLLR